MGVVVEMAANFQTQEYLESESYEEIKTDLLCQLALEGISNKYYIDLINDYMDLWVTKSLLVDDIQERGVSITYDNGGGQTGSKKNDSIEQRIKVSVQMLKILDSLDIKPSRQGGDKDDGEM